MNAPISILDKVIDSHKIQEKEHFFPSELVTSLLKNLTPKEEDILRRRFGLNKSRKETLEEIGSTYSVTRERIRQIENNSIIKIKSIKNFENLLNSVKHLINTILTENGGFIAEEILLNNLVGYSDEKEADKHSVIFILSILLKNQFQYLNNKEFRPSWGLKHASIDILKKVIDELIKIISENKKPQIADAICDKFKTTAIYNDNKNNLTDKAIISYLQVSQQIDKNPYLEYGLVNWGSINPKRINDKIYLVLKRKGKPMHFTAIAEEINRIKFDKRKAYPPTIHNELIMNNQYVLVGRGIYALSEWGYKPGVVSDVLQVILKKENKALSREELVKKVLEQRLVKKNTIHLALTNRSIFQKLEDGRYRLVE